MMKILITLLSIPVALIPCTVAFAEPYEAKCLYNDVENSKNEFHSCLVTPNASTLTIAFKNDEFQDGNQEISGNGITQIASGNYAKRLMSDSSSMIGTVLFAPIGAANRLFNRDYQEYLLDYSSQGQQTATLLRITPKDAPQFQQELRNLASGMAIQFEDPEKDTVIDVGPDL